ncbi:MAG: phosphoribosylanthranilate isomerase [Anaerolineae bacterium]|nr:phosphoribosylanthranilate isomerase [Anaerolineae bacterium]
MIIQIYAIKTVEEAWAVAAAGVEHLGVVIGESGKTPDEVSFARARELFAAIPAPHVKIGLTVETAIEPIVEMALATRPDVLHLSGEIHALPPEGVRTLRERLPGLPIMQAIPVGGLESVELARAYAPVSDYFLLDTQGVGVIGATGATHDWRVSRAIVEAVSIPVILAGGLSAENVAEAIRAVRPWGVDSNSHTNLPDGSWRKDPERVRQFVSAARAAE